jgi:hypothetical protein
MRRSGRFAVASAYCEKTGDDEVAMAMVMMMVMDRQ